MRVLAINRTGMAAFEVRYVQMFTDGIYKKIYKTI